ncbi:MAG: glycosyltransferase family 2 protein [Alphaproteobacteria bacterium]|nr:glycosyltransferase family 2 protein [Alphaproteobacteria bacterium]
MASAAEQAPISFRRRIKNFLKRAHATMPHPIQRLVVMLYVRYARFAFGLDPDLNNRTYGRWVARYDTLSDDDRAAIATAIATMSARTRISVVVPVYNTPEAVLRAAIDSVIDQCYPDWELCLADDASPAPHIAPLLRDCAARDARIRIVLRASNGGIAAATNSAIDVATGDYIALLDHDDLLAPHALYLVAREIDQYPEVDLLYSDEDKIDYQGRRYQPHFKSDWNPDLFLSQNMISHLGVYRTALVRKLGGLRPELDGSQDYDLALRVIEQATAERIRHIPHVLYHWRASAGSTAGWSGTKPRAAVASCDAVAEHLYRRGIAADVIAAEGPGFHEIHYPLPREPRVSIIIPTKDRVDLLSRCINSLLERTDYQDLEILIVDNLSSEAATLEYLSGIAVNPRVRVLPYPHRFNFSAINNWAAEQATGSILLFLNNDTEAINPDWLRHMIANVIRPEIGAVGAKLLYPNGRLQHGGVILGVGGGVAGHFHLGLSRDKGGYFGRAQLQQNLSALTAACLAMRREVFDAVGGFDADHLRVAFNDVDLCLKIREQGLLLVWTPLAQLYHFESASRGPDLLPERHAEFAAENAFMRQRWGDILDNDPYYNPNLSLHSKSIGLAFPPRRPPPWRAAGGKLADR